jgi:hypothetical protein
VFNNTDFTEGFAPKFRPLVMTQEVKLLHAAPGARTPSPSPLRDAVDLDQRVAHEVRDSDAGACRTGV